MNRPLIVASMIFSLTTAGNVAIAEGLNGATALVCSSNETFDCASTRECIADSPEAINIPRLIRLDLNAKKAFTKRLSGEENVAPIGAQQMLNGKLILQGVQNGYGWSMAISEGTGSMSLAIAGDGAGVVVFGTCMGL